MTYQRRLSLALPVLALLPAALLVTPAEAATSDPLAAAASSLQNTRVYVDPTAEGAPLVDQAALSRAIGSSDIKVAVLPASALGGSSGLAATDQLSHTIGDSRAVTVALIGRGFYAAAGPQGAPTGAAERLASEAQAAHNSGGFTATNVEGAFLQFIGSVQSNQSAGSRPSGGGVARTGTTGTSSNSGSNGGAILGGILGVVVVGGGALLFFRRRKRRRLQQDQFAAAKAEVEGLYSRLANDVSTLSPGDNAIAKQAMSDASERYTAAGSGLATSTSVGQLAAVRRTAIEGIEAARSARRALGLDPGPDPAPAVATSAPTVTNGQYVAVGQQSYQGYGSYQPGNPYYFGGGYYNGGYVPGGWYGTPFWEQLLITEAVFGGFGGWGFGGGGYGYGFGGGYGQGYDSGFNQGYDQGIDQSGGGGGDWGGGGGGDWGGGGGGDWGGGGGGDWGGGGGGDWGGGGGGDGGGGGW